MTVGELKEKIKGLDEKVLVVTRGSDHTYDPSRFGRQDKAEDLETGLIFEYFNEESRSLKTSKIIDVFVIG